MTSYPANQRHFRATSRCMRPALLILLSCYLLFSCQKEDDFVKPPVTVVMPDIPGTYLVEYTSLGVVSVSSIKIMLELAGYPQLSDYMDHSIKLYKLVYRTTYMDQPILASGIISYPLRTGDSIPTMIVGNGLTFADHDAPSSFNLPDNFTGFEFIGSLGYLTLIPDMIGFGVSRDIMFPIHNYLHSATAMIDFVYACEELIREVKIPANGRKFLAGYSQGGYIALSTLKMIEEKPVPDIKIEATAVGAGGFNLVNLLGHAIETNLYTAPSHIAMLLSSYNAIYDWNRPLSDFFSEPFAGRIPGLLNGEFDREQIDAQLSYKIDSLFNPVFLDHLKSNSETNLMNALRENCIDDWAPKGKLRIIHSIHDDRLPISDSEDTYGKMVSRGAENVTFTAIDTPGHVNAGVSFIEIVVAWFKEMK